MSDPIEPFDRAARRRARDRAAADFARFAFLKDALAADLAERLAELGSSFPRVLDLGSHDGRLAALLPESEMVAADAGFRFAKTAPKPPVIYPRQSNYGSEFSLKEIHP